MWRSPLFLEGQFLHFRKSSVSIVFFFNFTVFCFLTYWITLPLTRQPFLVLLTNQKLGGDYQYHLLRDYLAQQHSPSSPHRMWQHWERKNSKGLWLFCLFKGFFELGI